MSKHDVAEKLHKLLSLHGAEFGLIINQNIDDMDMPEIEIKVSEDGKVKKYVIEVK